MQKYVFETFPDGNNVYNCRCGFLVRRVAVVDCPECGKPLKKELGEENRYFCGNEHCCVVFVRCPREPSKTRVSYTGFARYKAWSILPK